MQRLALSEPDSERALVGQLLTQRLQFKQVWGSIGESGVSLRVVINSARKN